MQRYLGVVGLVVSLNACQSLDAFVCEQNAHCQRNGEIGVCEADHYCSFVDDECPSGRRYGEYSAGLSDLCTEPDGNGESTSPAQPEGSGSGGSMTSDESTGGDIALTFIDQDENTFEQGNLTDGLAWLPPSQGLGLINATTGTFTSRIFDAGAPVRWDTIAWIPSAPYGKTLPANGASESGYKLGNANMTQNVLLLRLDDAIGLELSDASGRNNHFTFHEGVPTFAPGKFGQALVDRVETYAGNSTWTDDDDPAFAFGTEDFTWALWVKSDLPCTGNSTGANQVYMGIENSSDIPKLSHMWLGCFRPSASSCPLPMISNGRPGGAFIADNRGDEKDDNYPTDRAILCTEKELVDNEWHHLAVIKGESPEAGRARIRLFFDGALVETRDSEELANSFIFEPGVEFTIGDFSNVGQNSASTLDEIAIWRRALSDDEILQLYRRGMLGLQIQVRLCADSKCSDAPPFIGANGSSSDALIESADALSPGTEHELPAELDGQYFQYQVTFSSLDPNVSPILEAVHIKATPLPY